MLQGPRGVPGPAERFVRGDVWAIGSTLYLLLTDRLPYGGPGETGALDPKCFQRPLVPPSRLNFQVDGDLDSIVARSLAVNPKGSLPECRSDARRPGGLEATPVRTDWLAHYRILGGVKGHARNMVTRQRD